MQNDYAPTNFTGGFGTSTLGFVQGTSQPDTATRWQLATGSLSSNEALPMWGGVAITDYIPGASNSITNTLGTNSQPAQGQIGTVIRATLNSAVTGFSVFDSSFAGVQTTASPVPLIAPPNSVNFFRLGTDHRIAVACDPVLAATLNGGTSSVISQVSWDFTNQLLIPYSPYMAAVTASNTTWANTSGGQVTFTVTNTLNVGGRFTVSGAVPVAYNGDFQAITGTNSSTIVAALPAASTPGSITTEGTISAEGGALPVKVLKVNIGNSMTVVYSSSTQTAAWNPSGTCAIIQI